MRIHREDFLSPFSFPSVSFHKYVRQTAPRQTASHDSSRRPFAILPWRYVHLDTRSTETLFNSRTRFPGLVRRRREKETAKTKRFISETGILLGDASFRGSRERAAVPPDLGSLDRFGKRAKIPLRRSIHYSGADPEGEYFDRQGRAGETDRVRRFARDRRRRDDRRLLATATAATAVSRNASVCFTRRDRARRLAGDVERDVGTMRIVRRGRASTVPSSVVVPGQRDEF